MYLPNFSNGLGMNMPQINMLNMGMQLPGLPQQMMNLGGSYPDLRSQDKGTTLKKVFIKDIHEEVPDSLVRDILKECGNIIQWKRAKNEKDKPMSFGSVEFDTIEGVLRSLRILNNMNIGGKNLQLKATEKTETFIKEWSQLKQKEWDQKDERDKNYQSFEQYLAADDYKIKERIRNMVQKMDLSKIREDKEKELEKKEHPRERERLQKKKQIIKDLERKYKDKLQYWEKREQEMERENQRKEQALKDKEKKKEKERLIEKELEWDSEEEKKKRGKYLNKYEERVKFRKQEKEEDELERKKEMKLDLPPEPDIIQPPEEDEEQEEKNIKLQQARLAAQLLERQINEKKSKFTFDSNINNNHQNHYNEPLNFDISNQTQYQNNNNQHPFSQSNNLFKQQEEEDHQNNYIQSQKDIQKNEMNQKIKQELEKEKIKEKVLQSKQELEKLVKQIPSKKKDLFQFGVEWEILEKNNILEKKIKPWLIKQSIQILGAEEPDFINIIMKKLQQRTDGPSMMQKFQEVLAEDTKDFIKKLWRMLIFEQLKIHHNQNYANQ